MKTETEKSAAIAEDSPRPRVAASPPLDASASRRRFSVHVVWTLAARILMTLNSVAAGVIVARWLGAEGLGQLAVLNVAVATAVQLGGAGLPSANTYFIARDQTRLAPAAVNSFIFSLFAGGLLALGLALLAVWRPGWFGFIPPRLVALAALAIPFQLVTLVALNIFLAVGRVERFNLLDLAGQSLVLVNAVVALVILGAGLWTLVSLNTAGSAAVGLLIAALVLAHGAKMKERLAWRADPRLFARMMRYGIKAHVASLAAILIFRADLFVVNFFRGAGEAGIYSVASQVAMMLFLLPGVVATLLFPRIASRQDERGELTCLVARHMTLVMLAVCLATVPASFALPALYGAQFGEAAVLLLILLPGVYLVGLESVLVQHFNAAGLPRAVPLFWVATLVFNVALTFALVPAFGARGAAVASTLSYAMIFALVVFYFLRRTGQTLSAALMPRRAELMTTLAAARSGALSR